MTFKNSLKTALRGLSAQKSRSLLTILGIIIGITAVILIMSLGSGAQALILSQIQGLGSNTVVVFPGREPTGPSDFAQLFSDSLKERDFLALKKKGAVPTLKAIMPLVFGADAAVYAGETYRLTIYGGTKLFQEIFDLRVESGSFFEENDVKGANSVVVIGAKVKKELFGDREAIGEKIKIKNRNYVVVGVLPATGQLSFFNFDDAVLVPYSVAQRYILGIKYFHRLLIEADAQENIKRTVADVEGVLRSMHGITDPKKDDFHVDTQADLAETLKTVTDVLTIFLSAVAAISLVVGGIGIMNIMLVSVTERTREIGLRKALGATDQNILWQFLLEAVILTASGGVVGIALGLLFSFSASVVLTRAVGIDWVYTFPVTAVLLGLGVATAVGLIFGLYPARKASLKSPIEALRYE